MISAFALSSMFTGIYGFAEINKNQEAEALAIGCSHWITINTSCGKTAKLCSSDYLDGLEAVLAGAAVDRALCP